MTSTILTSEDLQLRDRVTQQLAWDSRVDASDIGVAARDGVATLTGIVPTYDDKLAAERAAKRVHGIRAVANDLKVRLRFPTNDTDVAVDAARALRLRPTIPENVQAVVHDGHVTLTGVVPTLFQKQVAGNAVRHVRGVLDIVNCIEVRSANTAKLVKREIVRALHREADLDADQITVAVSGSTVVLSGTVGSWHEREAAEWSAMHAEGVAHVENLIVVAPRPRHFNGDEMC